MQVLLFPPLQRKGTASHGCGPALPREASEAERPSSTFGESRDRYLPRDPQFWHRFGQSETVKKSCSETEAHADMQIAGEGVQSADDVGFQKPPTSPHEGSDDLATCRSVTPGRFYVTSFCEFRVSPTLKPGHLFSPLFVWLAIR